MIILVRHAESERNKHLHENREGELPDIGDPELTQEGRLHA